MANKRSPGKEQFWRQIFTRFRPQRDSVRAFCQRHGLRESTFYFWRRELQRRDQRAAPAPLFVPVTVTPTPTTAPAPSPIELRLRGGRVLRLRPGFDAATLQRLLTLLETAPTGRPTSC